MSASMFDPSILVVVVDPPALVHVGRDILAKDVSHRGTAVPLVCPATSVAGRRTLIAREADMTDVETSLCTGEPTDEEVAAVAAAVHLALRRRRQHARRGSRRMR